MCNTSAVFQRKMLVVSRIFTYRDNSAKPNISQNFIRNLKKNSAWGLLPVDTIAE